ncbi:ATP-binding protein [Candidatus Margulisiibacteriota bacterium]
MRLQRKLLYLTLISILLAATYSGVYVLQIIIEPFQQYYHFIFASLLVIAALGFYPLEKGLQVLTNILLGQKKTAITKMINNSAKVLSNDTSPQEMITQFGKTILRDMNIKDYKIVVAESNKDHRYAFDGNKKNRIPEEQIERAITKCNSGSKETKDMLTIYGIDLVAPISIQKEVMGCGIIGQKRSGEKFSIAEKNILHILHQQLAITLHNKKLIERSSSHVDEMAILYNVSKIINETLNIRDVFGRIIDSIITTLKIDRVMIMLHDSRNNELVAVYAQGADQKEYEDIRLKVDDSVLGEIFQKGEAVFIPQPIGKIKDFTSRLGVKEYWAIPIKKQDKVMGLICCDNQLSQRPLHNINKNLLISIAHLAAIALENAQLYEHQKIQIQQLQEMQINIQEQYHYTEAVLQQMSSGLITIKNNHLKTYNKTLEKIFAIHLADKIDKNINEIFNNAVMTRLLTTRTYEREIAIDTQEGKKLIRITTNKMAESDDEYISIITDITQLKLLEKKARRAERFQELGTMAAQVAHEVKNPLASIDMIVQMLSTKKNDQEFIDKTLPTLKEAIKRLNDTVHDFLDFAKATDIKKTQTNISSIIRKVTNLLNEQLKENSITLKIAGDAQQEIEADPNRLHQVFLNLLLNAVDAVKEKKIDNKEIRIEMYSRPKNIGVTISDNGIGMDEENQKKIFTPFYTSKTDGTGLGLATVSRIIDEHNGLIEVKSKEGEGTTFSLKFPTH